jgi:hypothetical protein
MRNQVLGSLGAFCQTLGNGLLTQQALQAKQEAHVNLVVVALVLNAAGVALLWFVQPPLKAKEGP